VDAASAMLAAAGYNFKLLVAWLKAILCVLFLPGSALPAGRILAR